MVGIGGKDARLVLTVLTVASCRLLSAATQVPVYFEITPGRSNKAEVDLNLGEPRAQVADHRFEYAPPRGVTDTSKVVVSYWSDDRLVSRVDVHLKTPLQADMLRSQFGTRALLRDRPEGGQEEIYYPRLHALVFASKAADAPVDAIGYLSSRLVHSLYVERARERLREKRYDEAMTEADKALAVDADYAGAYVAQGDILMARQNVDEAMVRFVAGANARFSPLSKGLAYARLGELYWLEKKWVDKAEAALREAVRIAPDLAAAHYEYGRFLRAHKRDEALSHLLRAVKLDPDDMNSRWELAHWYWDHDDHAKARPLYEALSRWADTDPATSSDEVPRLIYERYAYALGEAGEAEAAVKAFDKALAKDPNAARNWNNRGVQLRNLGRWNEAIDSLGKALRLAPTDFWINRDLALALVGAGRGKEAIKQAEHTLSLKADEARRMLEMARCYAGLGEKSKAKDWIEKAIRAGFNDRQFLVSDPFLAPLREDSGFQKLLRQLQ